MAIYYIIEGPDGAGKTTLMEKIKAAHKGAVVCHFGKPETDEDAYNYWQVYMQAIKKNADAEVVIFDRCWYSDMVYGPVMRGRHEMTVDNMENLELAIKACGGGTIIYCTGKVEELWARCKSRGEEYITTIETLNNLCCAYDEVMKLPKYLPVIYYNTTARW